MGRDIDFYDYNMISCGLLTVLNILKYYTSKILIGIIGANDMIFFLM